MKLVDIKVEPGIYTEITPRGARRRWKDCDKIRFRYGRPEKMKGWVDFDGLTPMVDNCLLLEDGGDLLLESFGCLELEQ